MQLKIDIKVAERRAAQKQERISELEIKLEKAREKVRLFLIQVL